MDDLEQINAGSDHLPNLIYVNIPIILETFAVPVPYVRDIGNIVQIV